MKKFIRYLLIIFLISLILLIPQTAWADAAPPAPPPGYNPETDGELTNVQMIYEEVVLEITGDTMLIDSFNWDIENYEIKVRATFHMKNQGEEEERLSVRFPYLYSDGWGEARALQNFRVFVGSQEIAWQEIETDRELEEWFYETYISWAAFGVTFPPGKQVIITVEYSTITTFKQDPITEINYVLETGAGWYGSILEGDIILRMPYEISEKNVFLSHEYSTHGGVYKGKKEVHWHFENLEPTTNDNFSVVILEPDIWQRILAAQKKLKTDPNNINTLVSLAETSLEIPNIKSGLVSYAEFADVFNLGQEAVEHAISIKSDDPDLRALYGEILLSRYMSENSPWHWNPSINFPGPKITIDDILKQLNKAEALEPGHEDAHMVYISLEYIAEMENFNLPTLGPPPTAKSPATQTPLPSNTARPSMTSKPSNTATKTILPISDTPVPSMLTDTPIPPTDAAPSNTPTPTESTENTLPCSTVPGISVLFILMIWQLWAFRQRG